jgi:hypothetical protein
LPTRRSRQENKQLTTINQKGTKTMKTNFINSVFTSITILLIAGCASMTQAPSAPPSATVSIREWSAAYYGSATAGKGTLNYNGQRHRFTISGVGVGGAGGQKISATGKVYNLNNLSSFSGTYHAERAAAAKWLGVPVEALSV